MVCSLVKNYASFMGKERSVARNVFKHFGCLVDLKRTAALNDQQMDVRTVVS
jgi:hypothetical protein